MMSCGNHCVLAEHRGNLPPAVDPAQPDLLARHEAKEQDQSRLFARQRALRLHAAAELFVQPFDHVCRALRLPLRLGKSGKRQELVAALAQARHDAGRSEEHTSELQSLAYLVCRLLLEKKKKRE